MLFSTLGLTCLLPLTPTPEVHLATSLPAASASPSMQTPLWRLPVKGSLTRLSEFSRPTSDWGAGHRGVDFLPESAVLAPHAGRIAWLGLAFGVPTLVLEHGDGSTEVFQPVCALRPKRAAVLAGAAIASFCASKQNDHCSRLGCVHWSYRLTDGQYLNPLRMVGLIGPAKVSV